MRNHTDPPDSINVFFAIIPYEYVVNIIMYKFPDGEEVSRALLPTSCRLHWDLEMVSKIKYLSIATKCVILN